ncbi:MAG: DUF11 domain-containing protein [Pirellulales bacterium]|nr:DUF11 domain-containing protein [Pirellulales bacterium]
MKRIVLRVSALTAVVVLGVLAIAQAQRSLQAPADPQEIADADASADAAELGDEALEPIQALDASSLESNVARPASRSTARYAEPVEDDEIPAAHDALGIVPPRRVVQVGYQEVPDAAGVSDPFGPAPTAVIPAQAEVPLSDEEYADETQPPAELPGEPFATSATAPPADPYAAESQPEDPYAEPRPNSLREPQPAAARTSQPRYADVQPRYAEPAVAGPADADVPVAESAAVAPPVEGSPIDPATPRAAPSATTRPRGFDAFDDLQPAAALPAEASSQSGSRLTGFERDQQLPPVTGSSGAQGSGRPGPQEREGSQAPALSIEKIAPAEVQVGRATTFKVVVRNVGDVPVHGVELHDEVPQGAELVSTTPPAQVGAAGELVWGLGAMRPGDETSVEMQIIPRAEGEIGSLATLRFHADASVRTVATRPELVLEVKSAPDVLVGEDAVVTIRVANEGTGAATGVVVEQALPQQFAHPSGAQIEYEVGDLAPGESREVQLMLTAARPGPTANRMLARADGDLRIEDDWQIEVVAPALQVALDGAKRRFLEREATYSVILSNPGTAPAKNIELMTYLPAGFKFVSADNYGEFDPQSRAVHWSLEELPANESGSVSFTAVPIEAGDHKLLIQSRGDRGLAAEREENIQVEGIPAVLFEVVDVADPIEVGGETTYEIRVVNQGTSKATNVQVRAILPEEMKAVGAEGPTRHLFDGQTVTFDSLSRLAPKADTTYRIRTQSLRPGDLRIKVQLLTDDLQSPVTKEESTRVFAVE